MFLRTDPVDARSPPDDNQPLPSQFKLKGRAVVSTMEYLDKRVPGGRDTVLHGLTSADRAFFGGEQLFLASSWYDLFPYARLMGRVAELQSLPLRVLMASQARRTARIDVAGVYRMSLSLSTPEAMAGRVHRVFNRYFRPCEAVVLDADRGQARYELRHIPRPLLDFFLGVNEGFVTGALEEAGGRDIDIVYQTPRPSDRIESIETVVVVFETRFRTRRPGE
jgi:hypothetical protein